MSDMSVNRVPGEYTAPDTTAKRAQNRPDTSFAELLKNAEAAVNTDVSERALPQRVAASGDQAYNTQAYVQNISGWIGKVSIPSSAPSGDTPAVVLEKLDGESAAAWQRRCIAFETSRRWQVSSREWRSESADMDIVDSMIYCDKKATQWVTELRDSEPAMFREWLNQEKWHIEESGLDNAILPEGFTKEDMSRWLEKDVLEYL